MNPVPYTYPKRDIWRGRWRTFSWCRPHRVPETLPAGIGLPLGHVDDGRALLLAPVRDLCRRETVHGHRGMPAIAEAAVGVNQRFGNHALHTSRQRGRHA